MINTYRVARVCAALEPILEPRHFRHGIDERPVPLPPLVSQHAGGTAGWPARRQIMRHVHYAVTEHRARHQGESRRDRARVSRLVVLGTGRHPRVLLLHRGWGRRRRLLLILRSRGQRQRTDRWAARWTGRPGRRLRKHRLEHLNFGVFRVLEILLFHFIRCDLGIENESFENSNFSLDNDIFEF